MLAQTLYNQTMPNLMPQAAKVQALAASELMRGVTPRELERAAAHWVAKMIPANTVLFTTQQTGDGAYLIVRGTVKLHVEQADGSDVFIDISGAGDLVGEMSIVENTGRSATARALEDTLVLWIDRATFQEALLTTPHLAQNLMRILSGRLRAANERIQAMSRLDVKRRVVRQLLLFANRYGAPRADDSVLIQIRLTQADIADLVGATRERVNQVLGDLRRSDWIETDTQNHLTLKNFKRFAALENDHTKFEQ